MFIILIWAPQKQTLRQEVKYNPRQDLSFLTHVVDSFHPISCSGWNVLLTVSKELTYCPQITAMDRERMRVVENLKL